MSLVSGRRLDPAYDLLARVAATLPGEGLTDAGLLDAARAALLAPLLDHLAPPLQKAAAIPGPRPPPSLVEQIVECLGEESPGELYQHLLALRLVSSPGPADRIAARIDGPSGPLFLCRHPSARRARGSYFTPSEVVDELVDRALAPWRDSPEQLLDLAILDPAVGDGRFLVAAARWIADRLGGNSDVRRGILESCLHGIDIDPLAVAIARAELWREADLEEGPLPDGLVRNVRQGDSLLPETLGEEPGRRFDVVIGNPPFGSFSGRQAIEIDAGRKERYFEAWGEDDWNSVHGLFARRGLAAAGHTLAMVVPSQVGHLDGYHTLRSHLLGEMSLHHVKDWGEGVFGGSAVTPVMTFVARRDRRGRSAWSTRERPGWMKAIEARCESLGRLVGDPGVHTGNCSRQLIVESERPPDGAGVVPVLEGRQVGRFRCDPPRKWLRLEYPAGEGEYFTVRPLETYKRVQFVIRQTARHPTVGPKRGADYFRNSLLALYDPDDGRDVRYLVGLLNSQLIRFLYTRGTPESRQASFPQVKVRALRALPILWPDLSLPGQRQCYESILDDVDCLLEYNQECDAGARAGAGESTEAIESRIDECVFALYRLDRAAVAEVLAAAVKRT